MAIVSSDTPTAHLVPASPLPVATERTARCTNCGAAVRGRYCSDCGQSTEYHLHSFWDILCEAAEVVTHADSRLWRTLWPLVFRPGFLSQQFLAGRRASYLSPFRLYFVLSIVFFLIASVTGPLAHRADKTSAAAPHAAPAAADLCRMQVSTVPGPEWIREQFSSACIRSQADQGRASTQSFTHNLGRAMFIFLPLLAAAMQLMYWRPKRSYVTHLVLLVHNHAFAFLLMSALLTTLHWTHSGLVTALLTGVAICYLIYYLYRSIARVYAESWSRTLVKFTTLSLAYMVCAACTVFLAGLYSAETV
jgi:Protein of unknown function (DUF3667)